MLQNQPRAQPDKSETFTDSCSLGSSQVASKCLSRSPGSPHVVSSLMPPSLRAKCACDVFGVLVRQNVHARNERRWSSSCNYRCSTAEGDAKLRAQKHVEFAVSRCSSPPVADKVVAESLAVLSLCIPAHAFGPSRPLCCPFAPSFFSVPSEYAFQRCVGRAPPHT